MAQLAEFAPYLLVLAGMLALIVLAGRFLAAQVPAQLQKSARDAQAACFNFNQRLDSIELRVTTWKTEIDGLLDQVDEALNRTEKKRARTVASEARQQLQREPEPVGRQEIVAAGRRKVYFSGEGGA